MTLIIGLIVTAFILFFFEIFLPGGILAVIGGMVLLAACALTYTDFGIVWAVTLLIFGMLGALLMFFLEIRLIAHTRFGKQFALKSTIAAKLNPMADEALVGRDGITQTILAPTGKVRVAGKTYVAQTEDGFLEKGHAIKVVRIETFKLIVARS